MTGGGVTFGGMHAGGGTTPGSTLIQRIALSSPAATIDFSNIPATYENLRLVFMGRFDDAHVTARLGLQFNGDGVGGHYNWQWVAGQAAAASAGQGTGQNYCYLADLAAASAPTVHECGMCEVEIPAYARTVFYKTALSSTTSSDVSVGTGLVTQLMGSEWVETTAINEVTLVDVGGGNFIAGSVASLYGES